MKAINLILGFCNSPHVKSKLTVYIVSSSGCCSCCRGCPGGPLWVWMWGDPTFGAVYICLLGTMPIGKLPGGMPCTIAGSICIAGLMCEGCIWCMGGCMPATACWGDMCCCMRPGLCAGWPAIGLFCIWTLFVLQCTKTCRGFYMSKITFSVKMHIMATIGGTLDVNFVAILKTSSWILYQFLRNFSILKLERGIYVFGIKYCCFIFEINMQLYWNNTILWKSKL